MTYSIRQAPPGALSAEEIAYSPFVPSDDDDYHDMTMMGAYDFAGAPPLMPQAYSSMMMPHAPQARAAQQPRVMRVPVPVPTYTPPPGYRLVPLSGSDSTGMSAGKTVLIVLAVIAAIAAIVYYIKKNKGKGAKAEMTPTQAVKKLPTSRLAQNLYARLAKNGKASHGVLAVLDQIAQE